MSCRFLSSLPQFSATENTPTSPHSIPTDREMMTGAVRVASGIGEVMEMIAYWKDKYDNATRGATGALERKKQLVSLK